jgi:DNA-binding CsgD family transcriptional regulator
MTAAACCPDASSIMPIAEQRLACRSGDPMFAVDDDLRVRTWNAAVERLTGIRESDAIGRPCWQLLGGTGPDGSITCHSGCSHARLAFSGWPVRRFGVDIRAGRDRLRADLSTMVLRGADRPLLIHLVHEAAASTADSCPNANVDREPPPLTPRQQEVFDLMGAGAPAKVISRQLGVAEATVRNHIRAILVELRCNSQLAAVAKGRALGILH